MSAGSSKNGCPSELESPRRNRYFDGNVLTAAGQTLEQEYRLARERRLNLHVFGYGVVSGLGVTTVQSGDEWGIHVSPGLAIDGCGRLVVVPEEHELVPLALTDAQGHPIARRRGRLPRRLVVVSSSCPRSTSSSRSRSPTHGHPIARRRGRLPRRLVVSLCYRECPADFRPAPGSDEPEAATWLETYAIRVSKGKASKPVGPSSESALDALRAGSLHDAVCALSDALDASPPADPCIVLANVTAADDGTLDVEQCTPRPIVPTNRLLLALVGALAERIERREV